MAAKPVAALVSKLLNNTFLSNVLSLCVRFPKSGLIFIYERHTFPSTVAFTFCVLLLRCTQLTRPDHNYESYKYRVWPAAALELPSLPRHIGDSSLGPRIILTSQLHMLRSHASTLSV